MKVNLHTCTYYRGDIALYNVEVLATNGIGIHVVGIPDEQVKMMLLRVLTAIQAAGYHIPAKKIVINIKKAIPVRVAEGMAIPYVCTAFDLAITAGILIASGQVPAPDDLDDTLFFGAVRTTNGEVGIPFCGHVTEAASAVVETLEWQLRAMFGRIYVPSCLTTNALHAVGVSNIKELINAFGH